MKSIKTYLMLAAVSAALCAASCKKGDATAQQGTPSFLTSAPWKSPKSEWRTTGGTWMAPPSWASLNGGYPPTITFLENNTYVTTNANGSSGASGTWQLSADRQQLILVNSNGSSMTATIATLTATTLQLSKPQDPTKNYTLEGSGTTAKYTYYDTERTTFTH
jgi:hypothetical protein